MKKKVIVGMSGGVDSTVTAALLKKTGFEVQGVFLEFWKDEKSKEGYKSAKKMAKNLGISLKKINAEKEFKEKIVDKFIKDYREGITPNPCVVCNPTMKFEVLLKELIKENADCVATGHYALIKDGELFKARDKTKDQSYFLYGLSKDQIKKTIFPLGDRIKEDVREVAREMGLEVADREESQDICFVSQGNFDKFLKDNIEDKSGEIRNEKGKFLGEHKGLHYYTIGQRKGINLGGDGPYYVAKKDIKNNLLIVSNDVENKNLLKKRFSIKNTNWISNDIDFPLKAEIKVRYHSNPVHGTIGAQNSKLKTQNKEDIFEIRLEKSQQAITPGQSAVFYDNDKALGGGIII